MMQYWNLASKTYRFGTLESFNRYESALGCICKSDSFGTEMRAGEKIPVIKRLLLTKVQYSDLHAEPGNLCCFHTALCVILYLFKAAVLKLFSACKVCKLTPMTCLLADSGCNLSNWGLKLPFVPFQHVSPTTHKAVKAQTAICSALPTTWIIIASDVARQSTPQIRSVRSKHFSLKILLKTP